MKKINYLFTPLILSFFFIAGCSEKKDNGIPDGEITYEQFKDAVINRKKVEYNHIEYQSFYGYIDDLLDRKTDGTPILDEASLDRVYYIVQDKYLWEDESGDTFYIINNDEDGYYLNEETIEEYLNPPDFINDIKYYKEGKKYKVVMKAYETDSHIYEVENICEYNITSTFIYDESFYMTDYLKTCDDLLPIRVHDNKILFEEHIIWSYKD